MPENTDTPPAPENPQTSVGGRSVTACSRSDYPAWICYDCGVKYGRRNPGYATWHPDECGVCSKNDLCTEPRDFGHLREDWRFCPANAEQSRDDRKGLTP